MSINNRTTPSLTIKSSIPKTDGSIVFSFKEFRFDSIKIEKKFNNHFKDENDLREKIVSFMSFSLPWFSNETISNIEANKGIRNKFHFHKIENEKLEMIEEILAKYAFSQKRIDSLIDGNSIYQFSPLIKDSPRIIAEKVDNVFSILFWDVNHHIYINAEMVEDANSLFFEVCPVYNSGQCCYMDGFCFAVDFIDESKVNESMGYTLAYKRLNE
ncbi:MAG: hypothetical protein ACOYU3_07105 [Bacillota bacterium]